jgi:arylsulfatase A-like enzyme
MSKRFLDQRWPWWVAAAAIVVAFLSTVVEVRIPGDPDRRPIGSADDIARLRERTDLNLLFILIDTLRADRLGSYGYERDTSPTLDRIASQGVRFERHLAQSSWTKCSMASLWTGLYPTSTGVTRFDHVIPDEARLPAEILKESGFQTVGIYRNGWVSHTFGFNQGFDVYQRPTPGRIPPNVRRENPTLSEKSTDEDAVAAALEFLLVGGRERWFLYLHLMDVHEYLYDEESALFGSSHSDIYDNSIRWTDGVLELLLDHLSAGGYLEHTLIVITSDHGEAFRERGFEGHARKVYRETTEVPLILSLPFRLESGVVVNARSRGVDVWPTVLDLMGLEVPPNLDGHSLVPTLLAHARGSASDGPDATAVAHLDQTWGQRASEPSPTVAVSEGSLRYVSVDQGRVIIEQLFDRVNDPHELDDRAQLEPEAVERLRGVAEEYLDATPTWGEAPTREIGELELNHLRALGYAIP